jgi:hypothetical protein
VICRSLDNASLAALVGAAAAFLLVVVNDWRRNRRIATKQLPVLLHRLLVLVESRHKGAVEALASVGKDSPMGNIGLPFPVDRIERYAEQVGDRLTDRQAFALDNICFLMREADRLNNAARETCLKIDHAKLDITPGDSNTRQLVHGLTTVLQKHYGEESVLLAQVRKLITAYLEHRLNERGGVQGQVSP